MIFIGYNKQTIHVNEKEETSPAALLGRLFLKCMTVWAEHRERHMLPELMCAC